MAPSEIARIGERIYGRKWRRPLAAALEVDVATLRRWTSGQIAVPGPVALAIRLMDARLPAEMD
jgi:DNA-binding transcriptional regulator YiaG